MVDLAKLRKKAKKKDEEAEATAEVPPAAPELPPADSSVSVPETAPASKVEPVISAEPVPVHTPSATSEPPQDPPAPPETAARPADATSKLQRFMTEAGRKRDEAIASAAAETEDGAGILELLTFVISGEHYAVDIESIVEIVRPKPLTRIPNAEESIVGIMSLRGTIVTLVDASLRLGHRNAAEQTDDTRVVVIDRGNEILGFSVDRVLRVVKIPHDSVEPHPVVHASEQHEAIRGVFRVANALTILLDLDKLLDHTGQAADPGARKARVAQR